MGVRKLKIKINREKKWKTKKNYNQKNDKRI